MFQFTYYLKNLSLEKYTGVSVPNIVIAANRTEHVQTPASREN